jgi:hypothetical protein
MNHDETTTRSPKRRGLAARAARGTAVTIGTAALIWLLKALIEYLQKSPSRAAQARKARATARKVAAEAAHKAAEAKLAVRSGMTAMRESTRGATIGPADRAKES